MKKRLLELLAFLVAFPMVPRTALIRTELSYKVRNAKGSYSFGAYRDGLSRINLANGNLIFSRSLVSRPGRGGFTADISLVYNSKIWDRVGNVMTIPEAGSWVGLGWRIAFPMLVQGSSSYAIILPDGSSHEIADWGGGVWRSVDSTYMRLDPAAKVATLKDGVKVIFGNTLGARSYMTEMKDRNGNQIKVTYLPGTGKISQVQDTLGVLANFSYSTEGMLASIQSHGKMKATITFDYVTVNPSPSFSIPYQVSQQERLLTKVTIKQPAKDLRQVYSYYSGYGELWRITNVAAELVYVEGVGWRDVEGRVTSSLLASYDFATIPFYDDVYGSVEERLMTRQVEYLANPDGAVSRTEGFAYSVDQAKSNPSLVSVIELDNSALTYSETDYTLDCTVSGRNWSDGLLRKVQRKTSPYVPPQRTLRTEEATWTQDNPPLTFVDNPRVTSRKVMLDDNQFAHTDYTYTTDGTGNVRTVSEYEFGGALIRSTTTNYLHETNPNYTALNLTGLPTSVSIANGTGTEVSRTEYTYDDYPLTIYGSILNQDPAYNGSFPTRGNQTTVRQYYREGSRYVTSSAHFDVAGSAVSSTDARGNTTSVVYSSSCSYAYPQTVTNALGHVTTFAWWTYRDSNSVYFINGDLQSTTDPNGVVTSQLWYDDLDRKTQEKAPTETQSYSYDDIAFLATSYSSSGYGYTTSNATSQILDVQRSDPAGENIEQWANYDSRGQATRVALPFRSGGSSDVTFIHYHYDDLGRPTSASGAVGKNFSYAYIGNTTTVTDGDGKTKKYTYNAMGKVAKVTEPDDAGNLTLDTTYEYDVVGRLTRIVQGSQTRAFVYDSLGRLTSEIHPESGTASYTYDDSGNLRTRTDARGIVATHTYDNLNRRTGSSYSDGMPSATFRYDETGSSLIGSITNGKGRETSAWTSEGIGYSWSYDASGRALTQVFSIDGTRYSVSYNYTDSGCGCSKRDLQSMTYPNGLRVNYSRDSIGRILSVSSPRSPSPIYYIQNIAYDSPEGSPSKLTYASDRYDTLTFNSTGIQTIEMTAGIYGAVWTHSLTSGGRISHIDEKTKRKSGYTSWVTDYSDYVYDARGRLKSTTYTHADGYPGWTLNYSYDRYGNMLSLQDTWRGTTTTFPVDPGTNRLTNQSYDSAGNLTAGQWYSYNAMGLLAKVNSGQLAAYRYDALGRRVKKTWNYSGLYGPQSGSMIYVYGQAGEILAEYKNETIYSGTENSTTNNIQMKGQMLARYVTGSDGYGALNRVYLLRRNIRGEVVWTDSIAPGTNSYTTTFTGYAKPFTSGGTDQFPGQKEDPETGLKDFGARYYNPSLARWTSPDKILGRTYDPLSLNKYAYVRNDPVNKVDQDGSTWVRTCGGVVGGDVSCTDEWIDDPVDLSHPPGDIIITAGHGNPAWADLWQLRNDLRDWWNRVSRGINTSITEAERNRILTEAKGGIGARVLRENCSSFLNGVVKALGPRINSSIKSATDLISVVTSQVNYNLYGGINDPRNDVALRRRGFSFADTVGNTIFLGENFFDASLAHSYNSQGGDRVSTLVHEFFHTLAASSSSVQITEAELNKAAGGNFGISMRGECGP